MSRTKGIVAGLVSSSTFGLIPLFALPLMESGFRYDSVLSYRYFLAAMILLVLLRVRRVSLRISGAEFLTLLLLSFFSMISAILLFEGYEYLSSGVATTIHFLYPVFVALLMSFFFKEKASLGLFLSLGLAVAGVAFLSLGENVGKVMPKESSSFFSFYGVLVVAASALTYAIYIVAVNKSRVRSMEAFKMTFYVMFFNSLQCFLISVFKGDFQLISGTSSYVNIFLLALIPTVISNFTLIYAISIIGSTFTAVLGALESVTAVCVGIVVFGEPFSFSLILGASCVIGAVNLSIIVVHKQLQAKLRADMARSIKE